MHSLIAGIVGRIHYYTKSGPVNKETLSMERLAHQVMYRQLMSHFLSLTAVCESNYAFASLNPKNNLRDLGI